MAKAISTARSRVVASKAPSITEALDVLESGKASMLEFGVADETAWRVGLSCGGRIRVYVERLA